MKILITCQFFNYFSGSATYVLDLALELKRRGNDVTIMSNIGGEITEQARAGHVRVVDFNEIADIINYPFDIIHANQQGPTEIAALMFDAPIVQTLHNSLGHESPYIHPKVRKYVAAKPSEVELFKALSPELVTLAVDLNKYSPQKRSVKRWINRTIAFIGTYDYLREKPLKRLIELGEEQGFEVVYIGRPMQPLDLPKSVKIIEETSDIPNLMNSVDAVASILQGRTAVEAWACGKDYWCFDVDRGGNILSLEVIPPPVDMIPHDIRYMTDRMESIYRGLMI